MTRHVASAISILVALALLIFAIGGRDAGLWFIAGVLAPVVVVAIIEKVRE